MRIAIIGSGIAGMTAAHLLHRQSRRPSLRGGRPAGRARQHGHGGPPGGPVAADTGFLVYNERTYPLFTRLLADLGVATHPSDMSFSLSDLRCGLEWRGTSLSTVFAQRRNAARPAFLAMLADVARFNRLARRLLAEPACGLGHPGGPARRTAVVGGLPRLVPDPTGVGHLVVRPRDVHRRSRPGPSPSSSAATGSSDRATSRPGGRSAADRPATCGRSSRRCVSRGRLHLGTGGGQGPPAARAGSSSSTAAGPATFDHVVLATHSDQALGPAGRPERRGAPRARRASATSRTAPPLHTDAALLPANQRAWAAWNYVHPAGPTQAGHADLLPEPPAGLPGPINPFS